MSEQKLSDRHLERSFRIADRRARQGNRVYELARNLVFGVGLTASIFLPLASSDSQPPNTIPAPATHPIVVNPAQPVVQEVIRFVDRHPNETNIDVQVVTSPLEGVPPMTREWHRTTFSQDGDEFWALPDANFIMRFTPIGEAFSKCIGDDCEGRFRVTRRDGTPLLDLVADKNRRLSRENEVAVNCEELKPPLVNTFTLRCLLDTEPDNTCVEVRRSEHPPVTGSESRPTGPIAATLALDIRWSREDVGRCAGQTVNDSPNNQQGE